ncbi:hypothetical protein M441DRAFT_72952 [Trichoderma asperellum CBS 433.97]|uniref:ATPase AAA-type core domain-containing protein n=1 Tax=Trichoderma asperellum (strain ATCC 204424 / CBS 433.97 / NBRC 101777) TaxID=1042311 RepID=A0A2T3YWH4_TRIA4|nr:hypothetical protein M441DRAFT_72952 [Trichoderma asperellum CBS 433.97]PTB36887.1 hypothetical protein M441DRAFT_72952 [Trichoderma asperellum CBS 433.97]
MSVDYILELPFVGDPGSVIWVNGFPGSGNLTVARELARIYMSSILIENHKLIDPVETNFPQNYPQYQIARERRREWAFEHFVSEPTRVFETVISIDLRWPFIPVYLSCDVDDYIIRATSTERTKKKKKKKKLARPDSIRAFRTRCKLFQFGDPLKRFTSMQQA